MRHRPTLLAILLLCASACAQDPAGNRRGDDGGSGGGAGPGGAGGGGPGPGGSGGEGGTGGAGGTGGTGGITDPCATITELAGLQLVHRELTVWTRAQIVRTARLRFRVEPNLGLATDDIVQLDVVERDGEQVVPSTIGLVPADEDLSCVGETCLTVFEDDEASAGGLYYPLSGTLVLERGSTPVSQELAGELRDVTLIAVRLDPETFLYRPDPTGRCLHIERLAFDSTESLGAPCENAVDCGDTTTKGCSPETRTCVALTCAGPEDCAGNPCIKQDLQAPLGLCLAGCDPFGPTTCGEGMACLPASSRSSQGVCLWAGAATEGEACTSSSVDSGCAPGLGCLSGSCRALCDFWSDAPACPGEDRCVFGHHCRAPVSADPAEEGLSCDPAVQEGWPCLDDGAKYQGSCLGDWLEGTRECRRWCRDSGDCPRGHCGWTPQGTEVLPICYWLP